MKLRHELVYDASPAEVFAMLSDPAFREKVCTAQEVLSADITLTPAGSGFTLVSKQVQNTAGLPAIAKKIVGETTHALVEERWHGPDGGTIEITAPGKPMSAAGTVTLSASSTGTVELVELDVKVKVPLIGGKLESVMGDTIKKNLLIEQTVGAAWLGGAR